MNAHSNIKTCIFWSPENVVVTTHHQLTMLMWGYSAIWAVVGLCGYATFEYRHPIPWALVLPLAIAHHVPLDAVIRLLAVIYMMVHLDDDVPLLPLVIVLIVVTFTLPWVALLPLYTTFYIIVRWSDRPGNIWRMAALCVLTACSTVLLVLSPDQEWSPAQDLLALSAITLCNVHHSLDWEPPRPEAEEKQPIEHVVIPIDALEKENQPEHQREQPVQEREIEDYDAYILTE